MAKFERKGKEKGTPEINTASLPDIVFMLLFFFMVATTMKETTMKVKITLPRATETVKLEKKSLVSFIYIGTPMDQSLYGTEPKIQLDDSFHEVSEIQDYIIGEREKKDEKEVPKMTTSLKADEKVKMGIIQDVKLELRKVGALKLNYSARKGTQRR